MSDKTDTYRLGTLALHAGQTDDPATHSRAVPIYSTVAYNFTSTQHAADLFALKEFGNIYSRLQNPTCDVLEKRLAALDGGVAALSFASGMAAVSATLGTLARAGHNIVASSTLYGGTVTLLTQTLRNLGIESRFFDPDEPDSARKLIDENTRCVYIESVGNPKNNVPDFQAFAEVAHAGGVPLVVDNTVLTPALFRPLEHGADIVVYSTTKYIGGHGVHVGGAVVDGGRFDWSLDPDKWPQFAKPDPAYHGVVFTEALREMGNIAFAVHMRTHWLRDTGGCMSPFAAFLFLLGLETLHLRMPMHVSNAQGVAEWLASHECVDWVNYPGLEDHPHHALAQRYMPDGAGAIIGFGIRGGREAGAKFIDSVRLASHLANIGDAKTLVIHPASTTHQQLSEDEQRAAGVSPEYIRLCVGIEDVEDIKADLDQALRGACDCD
jgi:O-acetylhomoserine (thiol)-lyase